ncbi:hypothetical protein FKP32DRAFT_343407 [Trametes sanguinea]|nr:hypothetical protein FKP32DRAFT_343407 [Trametes sanguinea]
MGRREVSWTMSWPATGILTGSIRRDPYDCVLCTCAKGYSGHRAKECAHCVRDGCAQRRATSYNVVERPVNAAQMTLVGAGEREAPVSAPRWKTTSRGLSPFSAVAERPLTLFSILMTQVLL